MDADRQESFARELQTIRYMAQFIPSIHNDKPSSLGDPRTAYNAAEFFCGQFAKTLIVFFRHDFGERYFNIVDSFGASLTFLIFAGIAGILIASSYDDAAIGLFFVGFIAMCILHLFLAKQRDRAGRRWHSRYTGTSYLAILAPGHDFFVKRYVEPFLAVFAGAGIFYFNHPLGMWFVIAGLCIAVVEQLGAQRFRNRMLDAIDSQIEATYLSEAISGQTVAAQTDGFVLPVPTYYNSEQRTALYNGMLRLDPTLEAMIEETEANNGENY